MTQTTNEKKKNKQTKNINHAEPKTHCGMKDRSEKMFLKKMLTIACMYAFTKAPAQATAQAPTHNINSTRLLNFSIIHEQYVHFYKETSHIPLI